MERTLRRLVCVYVYTIRLETGLDKILWHHHDLSSPTTLENPERSRMTTGGLDALAL